jgi:hypothetical protein
MPGTRIGVYEPVPHVLVVVWPADVGAETLDGFFALLEKKLAGGERFLLVSDSRNVVHMSIAQRRRLAEWSAARRPGTRMIATITVSDSPIARGLLTAVSWFLRADQRAFSLSARYADEAVSIAEERLRAEGLHLDAEARSAVEDLLRQQAPLS